MIKDFEEAFFERTSKSREIFERARKILPGGVSANVKFMEPYPLYIKEAKGSKIIDVDGNIYIDYFQGAGPNILGHRPKVVIEAVKRQLEICNHPILATELEVKLAEKIRKHQPSMEMIRFCNTGSEANAFAMRVARAYKKKSKIAKFEGHFHGQYDNELIWSIGLTLERLEKRIVSPDCAGIPKEISNSIMLLPFNDTDESVSLIRKNANELAGVIMEPIPVASLGAIPAEKEFMKTLREETEKYDIPLIFDEVVTGFRLGLGGAAEYYGISPDLTALGKIIGGGFPIGAYGGRKDMMDKVVTPEKWPLDSNEKIFQSGTFSGNPISLAAGLALIEKLEKSNVYEHINFLGEKLRRGIQDRADKREVEIQVTGIGSLFHVHFAKNVRSIRDVLREDMEAAKNFQLGLIVNGIFLPPIHTGFISAAHTEEEIDKTIEVSDKVFEILKKKRA
ncbi:MAG: aspartate aminotransferase family protein [Nitrososphaerales archaeon]